MWLENLSVTSAAGEHKSGWGLGSWRLNPPSSCDFWSQALSP